MYAECLNRYHYFISIMYGQIIDSMKRHVMSYLLTGGGHLNTIDVHMHEKRFQNIP